MLLDCFLLLYVEGTRKWLCVLRLVIVSMSVSIATDIYFHFNTNNQSNNGIGIFLLHLYVNSFTSCFLVPIRMPVFAHLQCLKSTQEGDIIRASWIMFRKLKFFYFAFQVHIYFCLVCSCFYYLRPHRCTPLPPWPAVRVHFSAGGWCFPGYQYCPLGGDLYCRFCPLGIWKI